MEEEKITNSEQDGNNGKTTTPENVEEKKNEVLLTQAINTVEDKEKHEAEPMQTEKSELEELKTEESKPAVLTQTEEVEKHKTEPIQSEELKPVESKPILTQTKDVEQTEAKLDEKVETNSNKKKQEKQEKQDKKLSKKSKKEDKLSSWGEYGHSKTTQTPNLLFYRNEYGGVPARECYSYSPKKSKKEEKTKVEKISFKTKSSWGAQDFLDFLLSVPESERYRTMEYRHDYVQWVYPNFVESMFNYNSYALTEDEAVELRNDVTCAIRFVKLFRMFVNFLGGDIVDIESGQIAVLEDKKVREERFDNFNMSGHNYLRVTRIFNSLRAFGFAQYAKSFWDFFEENLKNFKNCKSSKDSFWKKALDGDPRVTGEPKKFEYKDSIFFKFVVDVKKDSKTKEKSFDEQLTDIEKQTRNNNLSHF
ncbi:hypothetical protein EIN_223720 [Entamoeba invadens IP1]|uniref:Opioid growth factor receptor (OGFr) conserved domain-containing protein n=1 Tax=Entamoeba invadens IP1 TaxID=370355 RepID=A0A0A1U2A3_ENTIV|nr:hypothetical protein EIN_223720 [Entamoeba invadens IP1]ELP88159.1 hypothetical protein EIN_223720 [Entamoeba invadens IP1]|eukprot:XP_004254930.1 hypothetical protein EIN_223720 [Entamoeba invadens IP1]